MSAFVHVVRLHRLRAPVDEAPAGPGAPRPDAALALADATRACLAVSTITAEIAGSGSVGGQRFRARLIAGLAPPASARLEAAAPFGAPIFILVASGTDATLLLPHDDKVLEHGKPAEVLEALAGLPVDAAELRRALVGCPAAPDAASARQVADDWRVLTDGSRSGLPATRGQAAGVAAGGDCSRLVIEPRLAGRVPRFRERAAARPVRFASLAPEEFRRRVSGCRRSTPTRRSVPTCFACRFPPTPSRSPSTS